MKMPQAFGCLASLLLGPAVHGQKPLQEQVYELVKVQKAEIVIDGSLSESPWSLAHLETESFSFPWRNQLPPRTEFKAFWDQQNFYFSFVALDQDIVVNTKGLFSEQVVNDEDRVELFFSAYPINKPHQPTAYKLPVYYAVEIDPLGRVHDYAAQYYRQFDSDWDMKGLQLATNMKSDRYIVEGKIPLSNMRLMGLDINDGAVIQASIFRAEFSQEGETPTASWVSWVKPNSAIPDFHIQSAFGYFEFGKESNKLSE